MFCLGKSWSVVVVTMLALAGPVTTLAQAPAPTPPDQGRPADPFGEELTLAGKTIVYLKGTATWDTAFETLVESYKTVYAFLDRQGLKPAGPAMTIYTASDDTGFEFQAAIPLAEAPKDPPHGDLAIGTSPDGKARKFVHRGSYDSLDTTYDAITHYLDDNKLEAKELYIEQYVTDLLTTPEDNLVIEVIVPIK